MSEEQHLTPVLATSILQSCMAPAWFVSGFRMQ
jgi:hypothetical protein